MNFLVLSSSSGAAGTGAMLLWIVVMFAIMYFLMIRPQRKEQKRMTAMLNDMEVGDSVVTTSGFYGVILDITDDDVIVEFGNNKNCRIPMRKSAIAEVEKANAAYATEEKTTTKVDKKAAVEDKKETK
ncbi:MAG: preprotein translocase subunit YajC [Lachnospiraceae bacterium]|nr:preprotein translocase subunit YajC [Lachnospiraceae bacterium]